ncbi:MAG: hypothetical protein ACTSXD_11705 [Candidatus Heimdallarchaeaceae archaeon]
MDISSYIKKWAEKLSISEEEINKDYEKLLVEEREIHQTLSEEDQQKRALQRLAMIFKKQLRSPAVGFEGMIIAVGDVFDMVKKMRDDAIASYKSNPQKTVEAGITSEEGVPLDTRQQFGTGRENPNFGKPLPEHNYIRNIFGVALKSGIEGERGKFFSMAITGKLAEDENIPMFKPVKFRAIDRSEEGATEYTLNASMFTKFEVDENIKMPKLQELLNKFCSNIIVPISELEQYHNANKENFNRLAIVKGDVSTLVLEPTIVGNRRIILEDEQQTLEDLEAQGITCWVPPRIEIDFAEGSKVIVIGRTSQGKARDVQGNVTDEPGDVMINVFGLYVIPEYKISPNVKEITEEHMTDTLETVDTTTEETEPEIQETNKFDDGGW